MDQVANLNRPLSSTNKNYINTTQVPVVPDGAGRNGETGGLCLRTGSPVLSRNCNSPSNNKLLLGLKSGRPPELGYKTFVVKGLVSMYCLLRTSLPTQGGFFVLLTADGSRTTAAMLENDFMAVCRRRSAVTLSPN
jgi:hypothetical protein